jgi:mannose/fructose/N-acetylgalactosamine-specific phosphotransferase system component IID
MTVRPSAAKAAVDWSTKVQLALRTVLISATWCPSRMQGLGFVYAIVPALRRRGEKAHVSRLLKSHLGFFNTNPVMSGYVVGTVARLIHDAGTAGDAENIRRIKWTLASVLGGIGDHLLLYGMQPALLMACVVFSVLYGLNAVVAFLLCYNIVVFGFRFHGVTNGAQQGLRIIRTLKNASWGKTSNILRKAAALFCGVAVATVIARREEVANGTVMAVAVVAACFGLGILLGAKHEAKRDWVGCGLALLLLIGGLLRVG